MKDAERAPRRARLPLLAAVLLVTFGALVLSASRLHLSSNLSALFPDRGAAAALGRFARAFGGGDAGAILVRGADPLEVERAANELTAALRRKPSILRVMSEVPAATGASSGESSGESSGARSSLADPTMAWAHAGPGARASLAHALTPEGMRARLDETRTLLLAPGSEAATDFLSRDPLRLSAIPWESPRELAVGAHGAAGDPFVADEGRARLVLLQARGSAFESGAAAALVADVDTAGADVRAHHPGVSVDLTGGHVLAKETEALLRRDLAVSSVLATVLASCTFILTFRRKRALVAVLPPLALGTLWTLGIAALLPEGLSAIAVAFAAVVVGVGVDTGVHVYSALLDARRSGLTGTAAARAAQRATARPTLVAAIAAGLAFGALGLSRIGALRQLGLLCGLGEILTAIAILALTPDIGAWLERGPPPAHESSRVARFFAALTRTPPRAMAAMALFAACIAAVAIVGWPPAGSAVVAVKPRGVASLKTQDALYTLFGGRAGQWIVVSADSDPARAMARSDAIAEAMEPLADEGVIDGFDALAATLPAPATVALRLAARDALDLPSRRAELSRALVDKGFDLETLAPALQAFAEPTRALPDVARDLGDGAAFLRARHVATEGGETLAVTYVRTRGDADTDARALAAIRSADPAAIVTGYPHLEAALKETLREDLPRVTLVAFVVVAVALRAALKRIRDGLLVLGAVAVELAALGLAMRAFSIGWHVYDALVIPVLLGVTLDEAMFLLHAARAPAGNETESAGVDPIAAALDKQAPLVASTALTTAAGFGALLACSFEGLRDMGAVGLLGVIFGLFASLVLVPAGLRLSR